MKKIKLSILILAAIAGISGFYYYQRNIYSKESLRLEILGQEKVDLFQEVEYIVKYKNNGNARLEEPELTFEYPEYSIPTEGTSLRVTKTSEELDGAIYPGEEKTFTFKARLLGKEGEAKKAKATLNYKPKNLKTSYESSTTFTSVIQDIPLTLEFDLPSSVGAGKQFNFQLNYFSNIDYPISNLRITVDYPSGFEFIESVPKSLEKNEWNIGILNRAQGGRIKISGDVSGQVGEEKVFQAKIGIWQEGEFILLKETNKGITLEKPSLYVFQQINGNPKYVASPGDLLHYEIFFQNMGEEFLNNLSLICKLEGKAFDFNTLRAPQGSFAQGDDSIIFDWKKISKLQFLDADEEGEVEFWIELKDEWPVEGSGDKNPEIKNNIFLSQIQEEFINKVNSKLVVLQKGYFQDEIFGNSGPIPPKAGEATTYTITWQLKNFYNDVNNVKVKAKLPGNVELTGNIFPETESSKFAFDSQSREIVWQAGDLKMSQGVSGTAAPNISFQVKLIPTFSQAGQTPEIIGIAEISGEDQWTNTTIISHASAITTSLPDDETITAGGGIVQ